MRSGSRHFFLTLDIVSRCQSHVNHFPSLCVYLVCLVGRSARGRMAHVKPTPGTTPGGTSVSKQKKAVALVIYLILIAGLIIVIDVLHASPGLQATGAVAAAGVGTLVLNWAFPTWINAVGAAVAVVGLVAAHSLTTQASQLAAPARCPHTLAPMALVQADHPVANSHPSTTIGRGAAHIDNVIAPDGSANVSKFETVCLTVSRYPAAGRQLWLILRLRERGANGTFYDLFYVVGALSDPYPGRYYSVAVDRHCSSQSTGDRHTLFVISAPASAAAGLWANYNARLSSLNSDCNTAYDGQRHSLPRGYYIASEQGDVIQH